MPRGLELLIAQTILQGFDAQYGRFLEVTSGAQQRFEQADWHAVQQAMKNRIHLYDHHVGLVVEQLRCITNGQSTDAAFLLRVKEHYTRLLPDYPRFEIAESFFNSVYCRLFDHRSLTPERQDLCLWLAELSLVFASRQVLKQENHFSSLLLYSMIKALYLGNSSFIFVRVV